MNKKIFLILFTFLAIGSLFVACDKEQDDLVTAYSFFNFLFQ
ncbi:MAG TPA: hypothetical protein PKH93_11555 [Chitinophagales bacterium]|nr:hypothetical protein [Chitinophagales bacterium]